MMPLKRILLVLALSTTCVLAASAPAMARTPFDGLWSVSIFTDVGTCDRAYRYPVQIINGAVLPGGADPSVRIVGRVDRSGVARVTVSRGDQWAHGAGRLSMRSGSGTWTSPSARCSGRWTAERRG
jgi:hypothetical protein